MPDPNPADEAILQRKRDDARRVIERYLRLYKNLAEATKHYQSLLEMINSGEDARFVEQARHHGGDVDHAQWFLRGRWIRDLEDARGLATADYLASLLDLVVGDLRIYIEYKAPRRRIKEEHFDQIRSKVTEAVEQAKLQPHWGAFTPLNEVPAIVPRPIHKHYGVPALQDLIKKDSVEGTARLVELPTFSGVRITTLVFHYDGTLSVTRLIGTNNEWERSDEPIESDKFELQQAQAKPPALLTPWNSFTKLAEKASDRIDLCLDGSCFVHQVLSAELCVEHLWSNPMDGLHADLIKAYESLFSNSLASKIRTFLSQDQK